MSSLQISVPIMSMASINGNDNPISYTQTVIPMKRYPEMPNTIFPSPTATLRKFLQDNYVMTFTKGKLHSLRPHQQILVIFCPLAHYSCEMSASSGMFITFMAVN
jgi:hypothetical protein